MNHALTRFTRAVRAVVAASLPLFLAAPVLKVLAGFNPAMKDRHIELSRAFTSQFVNQVEP
jgi:hypothetical protein